MANNESKNEKSEWYNVKQNHSFGYKAMLVLLKICPPAFMRFLAYPIGFFYWAFGSSTRRVSRDYLSHLNEFLKKNGKKGQFKSPLRHIISFALNLVENVQSWAGKFSFDDLIWHDDDVNELIEQINAGKGVVIVISHLGNAQMMKGLAAVGESGVSRKMSITTIADSNISSGFNAILKEINPDSSFHIVSSDNFGPETILLLQERLESGEVVVIAGDRVSANTNRNISLDFMGQKASFPYGVYLLISLLKAPTYFLNGLRHVDFTIYPKYDMYVKKNVVDFDCDRKEREQKIIQVAESYSKNLQELCLMHPYQWYNFFDFWS